MLCTYGLAIGQGKTLSLQIEKSEFTWTGKSAFSDYSLSGTIEAKEGTLQLKKKKIQAAKVVMDMQSMDSSTGGLVKHLKGKDFFQLKKYPEATFELDSPLDLSKAEQNVKVWLTIKDIREAIEAPVVVQRIDKTVVVNGNAIVNRVTYGVNYNSPTLFPKLTENAIADEFELAFKLVFEP